jgi:hypothetical protein
MASDLQIDYDLLEGSAARLDELRTTLDAPAPAFDTPQFGRVPLLGGATDGFFTRWNDGSHQVAKNLAGLSQFARDTVAGFRQTDAGLVCH